MAPSDVAHLFLLVVSRIMAAEWQGTGDETPKDKLQRLGPGARDSAPEV